jgi:tetratricopeptide (TPR) repeat protein
LDARSQIQRLTQARRKRAFTDISLGQYRKSLLELQALLDQDPGDPQLLLLQRRLQALITLAPKISSPGKAARAAVLGLKGYLSLPPNYKMAYNGLRYARELAPQDALYKNLLELLIADEPSLPSTDVVTPGLKLLEYKHRVALHQIYDAKYHLAILTLDEILALEPKDLLALKRLGSAYYSLGRRDDARAAWTSALKIAPQDATLKRFLSKLKTYKSSASTP